MRRRSLVKTSWALVIACSALVGCTDTQTSELPVLGPYNVVDKLEDGKLTTDTVFTQIRPFSFTDQDGNEVTNATFEGSYYVTDFFFTSCPTICPKMKQQMLRLYEEFEGKENVLFLSHSIDPKRDSVARLKKFSSKLGIESERWHMVTGEMDSIYSMARHYMIAAQVDSLAPGGYAHSGAFLLVDLNSQIRGIYDGTNPEEVDELKTDLQSLLSAHP